MFDNQININGPDLDVDLEPNILGANWSIHEVIDCDYCPALYEADIVTDPTTRTIHIRDLTQIYNSGGQDGEVMYDPHEYVAKIMRRELIRAYLYEAGLTRYAQDDDLCEALAVGHDKLVALINTVRLPDLG